MPPRRSHIVRPAVCTVGLSQAVSIWLGASSAAQPGPGPRRPLGCAREPCPIRTSSDPVLHCVNGRLLQLRRTAGLDHRAASHAPGAHVHL
eukprot:scaffold69163_cov71-Phaeocystis_antarctica.AAC.3